MNELFISDSIEMGVMFGAFGAITSDILGGDLYSPPGPISQRAKRRNNQGFRWI
jgi:hypothetical protein